MPMPGNAPVLIIEYTEDDLTLEDLCTRCHVEASWVEACLKEAILHPKSTHTPVLLFDQTATTRIQKILRLQRDFEMNLASVALVIDLIDELSDLRTEVALLQKHLLRF